jgi:hypothetical protein
MGHRAERNPNKRGNFMWHSFAAKRVYTLDEVVAACKRRIAEGGVDNPDQKEAMVELLRRDAPQKIVWSPFSTGWGASPFNPNCWRRTDGEPAVSLEKVEQASKGTFR